MIAHKFVYILYNICYSLGNSGAFGFITLGAVIMFIILALVWGIKGARAKACNQISNHSNTVII